MDDIAIFFQLRDDLTHLNDDWADLRAHLELLDDERFLGKIAGDIMRLDQDASKLSKLSKYRNEAHLIHYLLSTPSGAPFTSPSTLIDAARVYQEGEKRPLHQILVDFAKHSDHFHGQLTDCLEQIAETLKKEKNR